ncbi:Ca2+-binding RTX toxin-like protein [Nitrobacteraceae bacterium AZCC 1564]
MANTNLTAGSIAFTGYNGSGNDNLSFVVLTDIASGTVINFTDNDWNGSKFASGSDAESIFSWTATSDVAAGTVIDINNLKDPTPGPSTNVGSVTWVNTSNTGLKDTNETVYAYVGSASSPTFLAAIANNGFSKNGVLTNTGLEIGTTAIDISGSGATAKSGYNGARSGEANFADYLNDINNKANWITTASVPFNTAQFTVAAPAAQTISFSPSNVSVNEGDNGTKALTFTVTRSGDTTGAISFSGSFDKGSTNAADFGGTLPASTFSGTIAAGATSATITITISGDATPEQSESFTLTLTSASNPSATVTIGTASATGTIANDDGGTVVSSNTSSFIIANNDHVTILSNVTVSGSTAVTWTGGGTAPGAILDNFGTISGSTRGISTSGSSGGNLTIDNEAGATIQATKDAIKISNLGGSAVGTLTIINDGTIKSTGTGDNAGQALDLDDVSSSNAHTIITNNASGVIQAADADAIRGGTNATINNYGQIISHNGSSASDGNDAIDFQARSGGVVNNYEGGLIDGARHGITGDAPITVNNNGTITGENGSGINLDSAADTTTVVINSAKGTIVGHAVAGGDADGVDVDGLVNIDNFGTIKAVGLTTDGLNEALAIGGGTVHNEAGGLIVSDQRAITVDNSDDGNAFGATTIVNEGTIQGGNGEAISITGTFGDTITNKGTIIGGVFTDGGNDTFNAYTGSTTSGLIDLGDGNDTVHLGGAGAGAFGKTANVETLDVDAGLWTVDGTGNYDAINIAQGAILTSQISVEHGMAITVAGSLTVADDRAINGELDDGSTLTVDVQQGGLITAGDDAIRIKGNFANGTVAITNAGTIAATGGQAIDLTDVTATSTAISITNSGTITASDADAVRGGGNTTIDNTGVITSVSTGDDLNDAIDFQDDGDGTVRNHAGGSIIGAHHGITGAQGITVINDAGATIIGQSGSAVNIDNADGEANKVTVTNHGTLLGMANASQDDSDGDAVDVDGLLQLDNYGQIRGLGATGTHDGGANVSEGVAAGGGAINNYAGATIYGYGRAIQIDDSTNGGALAATTIYNEGTIQGDGHGPENFEPGSDAGITLDGREAINILGTFADRITNTATGQIIGGIFTDGGNDSINNDGTITALNGNAVSMGDGDDFLRVGGTITGNVDMGAGNDEVITTSTGHILGMASFGEGNDKLNNSGEIKAGAGAVAIDMGAGDDWINLYLGTTVQGTIALGAGNDFVASTANGGFVIDAGDGDDQIYMSSSVVGGDDVITGGAGNDTIYGGLGNDKLDGGEGNDTLSGEDGNDILDGGDGDDTLIAGAGDTVLGGAGNDVINVTTEKGSPASINGGDGIDTVNLQGTGTGAFGTTTNVENLKVQSGTWTIAGSQNYKAIDVAGGAMIAATVTLVAGETLTVEQGGTVQGAKNAIVVSGGTTATTVTNDGTINVTATPGTKADAISISSGTVTIHNTAHGVIEGARHAITGPGAITVINDAGGLIVGHNGSAVNMDNDADPAHAANITNYGTMLGDSANISDSDGDAIDVDGLANINNYGSIRGEGHNGYHDGEANVSEGIAIGGGVINNYAGGMIYGYGRAIEIDNSSNGDALGATTITNEGTIQGDGNGPTGVSAADAAAMQARIDGREAIDILGTFADTITNKGAIIGGVFTDGGNDKLTNSGTMTALKDMAIDMGAGDDSVTNQGTGTITGSVAMGEGNDSLSNDGTITVTHGNAVSMGDGDDFMVTRNIITGNVDMGAGNDELITTAQNHIFGTVSFGDGNDKFNSSGEVKAGSADAVAIDMGAGDDWINLYLGTTVQGTIQLGTGNDFLASTAGGGYVVDGGDGDDQIYMSGSTVGGDDVITGGAGNDTLDGGMGNDKVDGGDGNDTLFGGDDNDTLIGGTGSDLYYYWSGDGNDTIVEGAGNAGDFDTLSLGDFNISDVTLARNGDDLEITMKDGSKIVVSDQFADGGVENIVLKDGQIDRDGIVDATNRAPTVQPAQVTVDEDKTIFGVISATDQDGDKLTYTLVNNGAQHHGSFVLLKDGTWTYTPDQDYNGHDSFVVAVSDGHTTVETTIDVTINPVNDAPIAVADAGRVGEHDTATFDLVGNDKDVEDGHPSLVGFSINGVDGIDLSKDAAAAAFHIVDGKLQFDGGDIFGALNDGEHATVSITYTAEDSNGAQTTGEFVLTVDGVTDMHPINGTDKADVLFDTAGDDHITGGDGADVIFTTSGSDLVDAGSGNDSVMALTGNATVNGGDGNDTIVGGSGNTVLNGDAGNDTITGGSGNEILNGGAGNDTLISNGGNDILIGRQGNDLLIGGTGSDTFVFKPGDGRDTVANFKADGPVHDVIEVDSHAFANFDALMAAVHDTASGAQLQYADGATLTLSGVTKAHLTVDDFHFA